MRLELKDSSDPSKGVLLFQFHKGAIRTRVLVITLKEVFDFNSIKVRLEPYENYSSMSPYTFQFHKGAIRTHLLDLNIQQNEISIP